MADNRHIVAVTAIIVRDSKFLLTRRAMTKKRFPSRWTVPGGQLEVAEYKDVAKDTENSWHNMLEKVVAREVKEEVNLKIKEIDYLTSLTTIDNEGIPILVVSMMAQYESGQVKLQLVETDQFAWVTYDEAKKYDLYGGILGELKMADDRLRGNKTRWTGN